MIGVDDEVFDGIRRILSVKTVSKPLQSEEVEVVVSIL